MIGCFCVYLEFSNISFLIFFFSFFDSSALLIDAQLTGVCVCMHVRIFLLCYHLIWNIYLLNDNENPHIDWHVWPLLLLLLIELVNFLTTAYFTHFDYTQIVLKCVLFMYVRVSVYASVIIKFIRKKFHSMLGHWLDY